MKLREVSTKNLHKTILESEWAGFLDGKQWEPKSFSSFTEEDKDDAYLALFGILADIDESNFKILKDDAGIFRSKSGSPMLVFLYVSILKIEEYLRSAIHVTYKKKKENLCGLKGKIDFAESNSRNFGLIHKHFCKFKVPERDNDFFSFINFVTNFSFLKLKNIHTESAKLKMAANSINQILSKSNSNYNQSITAQRVVNRRYDNRQRYKPILPYVKVLANFYLGYGESTDNLDLKIPMNGMIFNLNRPFENLLIQSLKKTGVFKHHYFIENNHLKLSSESFNKVDGFIMKPDCWGVVTSDHDNYHPYKFLMLDAKHKIMGNTIDAETEIESVDFKKINRSDFYQISTYAYSHRGSFKNAIYGIVGLNKESSPNNLHKYVQAIYKTSIDCSSDNNHNENNRSIEIKRVVVNFGTLLRDLGREIRSSGNQDTILTMFGNQILDSLLKQLLTQNT